jgi:3-dehydroquinate synthase
MLKPEASPLMPRHDFPIPVVLRHRIVFTRHAFATENPELAEILREGGGRRAIIFIEETVAAAWPGLVDTVQSYLANLDLVFCGTAVLPGGEAVKADDALVRRVWQTVDAARIDRHSYVLAIGGGAFLDAVGFAAATAHRGVRLVRFPTTTLSQDDGGVGVKCAINWFGKKNWIGAFAVPYAVINDFAFLHSQDPQISRAGLIEPLRLATYHPALAWLDDNGRRRIFAGLDEFREHLGGELTVLLLQDIGVGVNVHQFDEALLSECIEQLRATESAPFSTTPVPTIP